MDRAGRTSTVGSRGHGEAALERGLVEMERWCAVPAGAVRRALRIYGLLGTDHEARERGEDQGRMARAWFAVEDDALETSGQAFDRLLELYPCEGCSKAV